jgi:hypothetical protein
MRLLRSWPARIPEGRHHVVDAIDRLIIDNHHYGPLAGVDDDVLLLEWDIAVGQEDLRQFAHHARRDPGRVLVAPYRIYADVYNLPADIWAHRTWSGDGMGTVVPHGAVPVRDGAPTCNLFGLGMAYLPRDLHRQFAAVAWSSQFGDTQFSMWHYQYVAREVPIAWEVRPVHLNYLIPDLDKEASDG